MKIYGYMKEGQLYCTYLQKYTAQMTLPGGREEERIVTEEEQAELLSEEWKPVDFIDDGTVRSAKEDEVIVPVPYDAGDRIAYRYERRFDTQKIRAEMQILKESLSRSDYKIAKCYEASLMRLTLPYDVEALHRERQAQRDRINELEEILQSNAIAP